MTYQFTDICIISENVLSLVKFYETVFGAKAADDSNEMHAGLTIGGLPRPGREYTQFP